MRTGSRRHRISTVFQIPGRRADSLRIGLYTNFLDTTTDAGVACNRGSLVAAHFVTPAGEAFGAASVVDADGAVAPRVVIEPDGATVTAGETDERDVPGGGANPTPLTEPGDRPTVKPAVVTTGTTVTKTTVSKSAKPKASASGVSSTLPKTADSHWIVVSLVLFVLGTTLLATARRC